MQNEANLRSIFFGEDEILVKLWFKGLNCHNFHIFIITNFKTDRYLNNFQEHLLEYWDWENSKRHIKISFPRENYAIKHDLVEFKAWSPRAYYSSLGVNCKNLLWEIAIIKNIHYHVKKL